MVLEGGKLFSSASVLLKLALALGFFPGCLTIKVIVMHL